jgi:hypothetical protein
MSSGDTANTDLCEMFYMVHESGDFLYPIKVKNIVAGVVAYRVSKAGNTKEDSLDVFDDDVLKDMVINKGYSVRASSRNRKRKGLYNKNGKSIKRIVEVR